MGKSGGKKKKSGSSQNQTAGGDSKQPLPVVNGGVNLDSSVLLKRAHELKQEGNKRFQAQDYLGAFQQYENAIKLVPKTHPDRAVFHSNRAACLMLMKPIDYDTVISECNLALQVQPLFVRALLRRARAYEAIGKYELAMQDVQSLLIAEPNHSDALEIASRLRMALGPVQQDLPSRPSPAALGASAVRGAPIAGLGPCLPARPVPKKQVTVPPSKSEKLYPIPPVENRPEKKSIQLSNVVLKPSNGPTSANATKDDSTQKERSNFKEQSKQAKIQYRQLKLVYDHDIRLAQMPVNCSFKILRDIVAKRFPMSKSVLIKYKDCDGDLITVTCSTELRLAESSADSSFASKDTDIEKSDSVGLLRLHVVEVGPEQEPPLLEDDDEKEEEKEEKPVEPEPEKETMEKEEHECKEIEMDDWLFEFAQLFRAHIGVDPDAHIDLHEVGMELCSEALEETVTSEEAQALFDKAASKFQEVAALAFFNWGNVHMCAARKRMPIDESARKEVVNGQLQVAYDWVKEKYTLAREKYEEALTIKPDFYEGLLALGQQQFEMAKLHWSFVQAKKSDLSMWDPSETIGLFDSAEEKMKAATEMWERAEEQRAKNEPKKEEISKRRKKQGEGTGVGPTEVSPEEAAEQVAVMRTQIHLFWGNMLFERSQIECKMGLSGWKKNLDDAVERFKLAGASEEDISTVLKNHCSNEGGGEEGVVEGGEVEGCLGVVVIEKGDD
ncbi:tetratricopeptide repeat-containing protein [Striga asiatica]|uniref:Tetratricopeptide repeat-containing protein n=1 Tax=Striga asiatica TaxID=4170 RepID=A0A5A7RGJ3_STRAF|nr:tetratricopeptide repeat-containing protein [Striga asiatica]